MGVRCTHELMDSVLYAKEALRDFISLVHISLISIYKRRKIVEPFQL